MEKTTIIKDKKLIKILKKAYYDKREYTEEEVFGKN